MKNKSNETIEIYCDKCKAENSILFNDSFNETSIICKECGTTIYWHNCPDCETGFSDLNSERVCPDCSKPTSKNIKKKRLRFPPFENSCPWCNEPVNLFLHLFLKRIVSHCPSCGKSYKDEGMVKSLIYFLIFSLGSAVIATRFLSSDSSDLVRVLLGAFIIIGGFSVFFKTLRLERCK